MFEGKPPVPATPEDQDKSAPPDGELHALSWSELVARLSAERELRTLLVDPAEACPASFDADFARHLAEMHEEPEEQGKKAVNPDDSGNRKGTGRTNRAHDRQHRPATRGTP